MKFLSRLASTVLAGLFFCLPSTAIATTITASALKMGGRVIGAGTVTFTATDVNDKIIPFVGGGLNGPKALNAGVIVNGAIVGGFSVPDACTASPANILYRIQITDLIARQSYTMMKVVGVCGSSWALDAYAPPAQTTNVQPLQVSTGSANPPDPCIDPYFYVKKVSGVSTLYICTDGHPQLFAGSGDGSGSAGTITVGTVTTGAPGSSVTVTNSGTSTAAILNFSIPAGAAGATGAAGAQGAAGAAGAKGDKGDTGNAGAAGSAGATGAAGAAATIAVGTVTTLSPGASATVSNAGSSSAATFNFGIPAGAAGATGATGATGAAGADGTNPFSDTTVNVSFDCAQAAGGSDVLPSFTSGHAYIYAAAISGVMNCEVHYADGTSGVIATVGKSAQNANNLSDLASASTARTNLGLGTAATTAASAYDASGAAAAVLGTSLQKASNLSDLASASTARTNLGLGTAATTATTAYDAAGAATAIKSDVAVSNVTTGAPATLTDGTTVTWTIGSAYTANSKLTFTTHGGSRTLNLSGIAAVVSTISFWCKMPLVAKVLREALDAHGSSRAAAGQRSL